MTLWNFVKESNHIEGIDREPYGYEVQAHERLLAVPQLLATDLVEFVHDVAKASLRLKLGMNVRIGNHIPPPGGPDIIDDLQEILRDVNNNNDSPFNLHCRYEALHPFMDGNGRSGRAVWAWHMQRNGADPFAIGFLHRWYYQSLSGPR